MLHPHKFAILFVCLWLPLATAPLATPQSFASKANDYVSQFTAESQFRGNILVARNRKILFEKSYGNAVEGPMRCCLGSA